MKKTRLNPIGRKHIERMANGGSEVDTFRSVRIRADNYSELSNTYVYEIKAACFAHILPKKTRPEFRLDPNNIVFVANEEEHAIVDKIKSGMREEMASMVREGTAIDFIKQEYHAHYAER